jgi:MOSC domain-containing protein YiiM
MKIQPPPPNLRQVHLLHSEFFNEVEKQGLTLAPGEIGENITTEGIDLLGLGRDTRLHFVPADGAENFDLADTNHAVVQVTGLRNPCPQIQKFRPGLQELCVVRGEDRSIVERKSGIMAIVEQGGSIKPDYTIFVDKPKDYVKLEVV